jgi:hypothetical protein
MVDDAKLHQFIGQMLSDLGGAASAALGAQAGDAKLREVITAGGFQRVRRVAETPFNMILEARP